MEQKKSYNTTLDTYSCKSKIFLDFFNFCKIISFLNYLTLKIEILLKSFPGIVVIDEAYIDFSESQTWVSKLSEYPNLIVTQTLSKAYGMAGIRLGICYASEEIISEYRFYFFLHIVTKLHDIVCLYVVNPRGMHHNCSEERYKKLVGDCPGNL